jgi:putative membrane protein
VSGLADGSWRRLDPRKLLLDPVKVLGQFAVPGVVALVGVSSSDAGFQPWMLPILVIGPLLIGAVPWLTTWYRITDTQFQQRSGLLNKTTSTAPLDRVRSVDLEASLLHRVLGMTKVQVGTGVDDDRITLDALSKDSAADLRAFLLARRRAGAAAASTDDPTETATQPTVQPEADEEEQELARIDWSWLRFAPFSLTRLVVVAGAVGLLSQVADDLPFLNGDTLGAAWEWLRGFAIALVVVVALVSGLVGWVLIAVTGYVVQWWRMRLTREQGSLHLTAGLVTTRSISVEERRVRGVELTEPLLLRAVGGAELATLATGVGSGGHTPILPPCPREVAVRVGDDVLGRPGTLSLPLVAHGWRARRRCHVRQLWGVLVLTAVAVGPVVVLDWPWWLPVAVALGSAAVGALVAEASYRHLGHVLTDEHLVAGSGALVRARTVLETDGIIGWVVSQSLFQRRAGLAHLTATTAAGAERVVVRDVPLPRALSLAHGATPGVLTDFRT